MDGWQGLDYRFLFLRLMYLIFILNDDTIKNIFFFAAEAVFHIGKNAFLYFLYSIRMTLNLLSFQPLPMTTAKSSSTWYCA